MRSTWCATWWACYLVRVLVVPIEGGRMSDAPMCGGGGGGGGGGGHSSHVRHNTTRRTIERATYRMRYVFELAPMDTRNRELEQSRA